jgi:Arm DNA-binding domain
MRTAGKLTDVRVRAAGAGTHGDGGGLYLAVKRSTALLTRSWLFRYSIGGRSHWVGLGAYPDVSLQRARHKAQECRRQIYEGIDPLQRKRDQRAALRQQRTERVPTFAECAGAYIASHEAGWRGRRTSQNWSSTLRDHAYPEAHFRSWHLADMTTAIVDVCFRCCGRLLHRHGSAMDVGADKAPRFGGAKSCKRLRPSVSTLRSRFSRFTPSMRRAMWCFAARSSGATFWRFSRSCRRAWLASKPVPGRIMLASGLDSSTSCRLWHKPDLLRPHPDVCLSRQSGQHLLGVSLSAFDP